MGMKVTMANTNMTTCSKLRTSSLAQAGARRCVAVRAASNNSNNQAAASAENENQRAVTRRAVVGLFAGAAVLAGKAQPSLAAYGEAANVFGSKTGNFSGFTPYEGDGYSILLPAKWNPSKEQDFPGTDLRYEDNADAVNNLIVTVNPTSKSKISDYGSQSDFLKQLAFWVKLLGPTSLERSTTPTRFSLEPLMVTRVEGISSLLLLSPKATCLSSKFRPVTRDGSKEKTRSALALGIPSQWLKN